MIHLGKEPHWVSLSNKVYYPDDIKARYSVLMNDSVQEFEKDFAEKLSKRNFQVQNVIIQPKGLTNKNLMCFANASMQLLFASPYFLSFAYFMKKSRNLFSPKQRALTPAWETMSNFFDNFQFSDSSTSDGATPSLKSLNLTKHAFPTNLEMFDDVFGMFSSKRKPLLQEDAIQFLLYFLNVLHEEVLSLISLGEPNDDETCATKLRVAGTGKKSTTLLETQGKQSPFSDIFVTLTHSNTLQNGKTRTVTKESHLVIPLSIQNIKTLEEAIDAFVAEEKITKEISKKSTFISFPKSIIFGLKPFTYNVYTGKPVKLKNDVSYPEILTLKRPFDGVPINYQLSAIVEHIGQSPESGHYVCYSRRFDGAWMKFDDDNVTKMFEKEYLNKEAYLLLYNQITSFISDDKK